MLEDVAIPATLHSQTHQSLTLRSLAILVAIKIQQTKRKEALSIGDYFKEVNYFGGAVQLGADLNNQDAWIQYPSQVPQDIQEPSYHLTRFPPEPVSLHLLYA